MTIPVLIHLAVASTALPMVAGAVTRRPVRGARGWIVSWCVALLASQYVALYLGLHHRSNLWVSLTTTPLSTALVLWAVSCFQVSEIARLTVRLALAAALVAWAVLTLLVEGTSTFSRAAEPMIYLICLSAAAGTLLLRSHASHVSLFDQDWFWCSAGIALYFAAWSALGPLSALLVAGAPELLVRAYEVNAVLQIGAMLAIARGMACPVES